MVSQLQLVADRFALDGEVESIVPLGEGHINATFTAATGGDVRRRYVLQRINRTIFPDPVAVIRNVERVTEHLRAKVLEEGGNPDREVLCLIRTVEGGAFHRDAEGEVWRCYAMIEGASAHSALGKPAQAKTVARSFGRFLRRLSDYPPDRLEITLPRFHDTSHHFQTLRDAAEADPLDRLSEAGAELAFIEERDDAISAWTALLSSGKLPRRVVHNDTKVDNVMVDDSSKRGVCVIDLDTVMPGSPLTDIGDLVRSALTGPETIGQSFRPAIFRAAIRGYLSEAGALLDESEIDRAVLATRLVTLELGIRFLVDYVIGDRWFPISRPGENLRRCRVQLELVRWIEGRAHELTGIVRRAAVRSRRARRGSTTIDALRFRIDGGRART